MDYIEAPMDAITETDRDAFVLSLAKVNKDQQVCVEIQARVDGKTYDLAVAWIEQAELARNGGTLIAEGLRCLAASVSEWSPTPIATENPDSSIG
jgi:hypothetical protein